MSESVRKVLLGCLFSHLLGTLLLMAVMYALVRFLL